ncbi:MAG: 30S ribosomal protein S2 [Enterococcus sp.]|nr:30S ribosomal protein S2 [Enterococcus sp.]
MTKVSIQSLIDAGAHFGHQTCRWNPKMKPYIFDSRGGIYIIDLKQTLFSMDTAYSFVSGLASKGGSVLFVGTKKQAQESLTEAANRCGMPYVNSRWLGGMLTNFTTIRKRVNYMEKLEAMETDGRMAVKPKKEQMLLRKEMVKLQTNLNGVRNMRELPDALFVVDTNKEAIAIREANRLNIPVIAVLDTNSDPDMVDFGIPANDDAIRSVKLMCDFISDAVVAGSGVEVTAEEIIAGKIDKTNTVEEEVVVKKVTKKTLIPEIKKEVKPKAAKVEKPAQDTEEKEKVETKTDEKKED